MDNKLTASPYITGFLSSLILTFTAYYSVTNRLFENEVLTAVILVLAIIQLLIQLIFFLHLSHDPKQRWNLIALFSTVSVILVIVIGSIWIMANLNYNMTPHQMSDYLIHKEGIHK
jgi:cytochrome o ubiquinol oxidase operon protein cyoD